MRGERGVGREACLRQLQVALILSFGSCLPAGVLLLAAEIDDGGSIRELLQALPGNVTQNSDLVRAFFEYQNAISTSDMSGVYLWVAGNSLVFVNQRLHSSSIVLSG